MNLDNAKGTEFDGIQFASDIFLQKKNVIMDPIIMGDPRGVFASVLHSDDEGNEHSASWLNRMLEGSYHGQK